MTTSTGRNRLHALVVYWTAVTFIPYWLPFFRAIMDGSSYRWSQLGFSGSGVDGDFGFIAGMWVLCLLLLWTGTQGPRTIFRVLAPLWHLFLLGFGVLLALTADEPLMFRGDTLGIAWDITWTGPVIYGLGAIAAVITCWLRRAGPGPGRAQWRPSNTRRLGFLVILLPIQFILLRGGQAHGLTDAVGVLLLIAQVLMLPWALSARRRQ